MAALKSEQSAQVGSSVTAKKITTVKNSDSAVSVTSSDDPIQGSPDPVPGGVVSCPGGATMPAGSRWQTIYCNGTRWASSSFLRNYGNAITINEATPTQYPFNNAPLTSYSRPTSEGPEGSAIHGVTNSGIGVSGVALRGGSALAGVADGDGSRAVYAQTGRNAYGIYEYSPFGTGKNYFQSKVGIGTQNPTESLDLGGGNIKMGYEVVNREVDNANAVAVSCPANKFAIGGGCRNASNDATTIRSSYPSFSGSVNMATGWSCQFSGTTATINAFAICANIR